MLKIYLVQMESLPGAKPENLAKAREMTLAARPDPNSLVLFPEMLTTKLVVNTQNLSKLMR